MRINWHQSLDFYSSENVGEVINNSAILEHNTTTRSTCATFRNMVRTGPRSSSPVWSVFCHFDRFWISRFDSTVYKENQASRQKGVGVCYGGEVCSPVLHRHLHHRLWYIVQDTGSAPVSFCSVTYCVNASTSFTLLRSIFLPYIFRHVTSSTVFVLFQQFINNKVQLIPAKTFCICAIFTFWISLMFSATFSPWKLIFSLKVLQSLWVVYNLLLLFSHVARVFTACFY